MSETVVFKTAERGEFYIERFNDRVEIEVHSPDRALSECVTLTLTHVEITSLGMLLIVVQGTEVGDMSKEIIAWPFDDAAPGVCTACNSRATMGLGLGTCAVQLCDECASNAQEALKRVLSGSNYAKQDDSIREMYFLKQRIEKGQS